MKDSTALAAAAARIEPDVFPVYSDVKFTITIVSDETIFAGSIIEVQIPNSFTNEQVSPSKTKEWQTTDPDAPHHIKISAGSLSEQDMRVSILAREYIGGYEINTRHGRCVIIELMHGLVKAGEKIELSYSNTTSPWVANQQPGATDHEGLVLVMIDGRRIEPAPSYSVIPGPAVLRRVIVPSSARPDEPFLLQLVSLDAYNNLSGSTFDAVDITCDGTKIGQAPAHTGRTEVEVSLEEPGARRLEVGGTLSNPIRICNQPAGPYWGDIHFHNYPSVDAMGNTPYEYARDVSCLDFAGTAEHGAVGLKEHWAQTRQWCREWNQPGRFVSILALETNMSWHHNLYFYEDDLPVIDAMKDGDSRVSEEELLDYIKNKQVIGQLHHTGIKFGLTDMRKRYPDNCRLLEIYSMHGQSELYVPPEHLLSYDTLRNRNGTVKEGPYYARDAWALGQRFVTHGSSDNHFGQAGVRHNSVTAVAASELTRESILNTLVAGHCYATTGERILLDFHVNDRPMGSEFSAKVGDILDFSVEVHGTEPLETVEVFACPFVEGNRKVPFNELMFAENDPAVNEARNSWTKIMEKSEIEELDAAFEWRHEYDGRPMVYYVRVSQRDLMTLPGILEGQDQPLKRPVMAWSSPVWITPDVQ